MGIRKGIAAWVVIVGATQPAAAYEFGSPGVDQKPGIVLGGISAAVPPPGIYMFEQFYTYQATITGPGRPPGDSVPVRLNSSSTGILFVPGWSFLGANYDAVIVQPVSTLGVGSPVNSNYFGLHNTLIIPAELSWKLGDTGLFVKSGFGIYAPNGTISGPTGLSNAGHPWWTFVPSFFVSYLKDGWNLTSALYLEMNTRNTVTGYTSGNIFHAEFVATKRIGKWTIGPVGYYCGQVSDDRSSAFYHNAINVNRYNVWAAGALVGYDFGPVAVNIWALNDLHADSSGSYPIQGKTTVTKGFSVFASMSFRLWAPDDGKAQAAPRKLTYK
ncbi:transporter [Bradyrhizobium sp. Ai1a-2]|uniref:SphA family protein n=1 Tax=Bradyrhizobium sp. Ai1a-2 TaxID=196490 RepID=UPI001268D159|nr:transporter [Bradyrhizobium sp. Ai1a-2]